ncbi:MAG: hypothetical protein ACW98F_14615 [Candidatus Hodarchaeales archaeon]
MAQKIYVQLFIGFLLLMTFILAIIVFFLEPASSSTPPASNSDFPVIYLVLMVLGALGILTAVLVRLRR